MTKLFWFAFGLFAGLTAYWSFSTFETKESVKEDLEQKRKDYALGVLHQAEFHIIGAQYSIEDVLSLEKEGLEKIATGKVEIQSLATGETREIDDSELVELLRNTMLSVHTYDLPCMCGFLPVGRFIFESEKGSLSFGAQYEGHAKISRRDPALPLGLSDAGKHVLMHIHHEIFPEDEVWRHVDLPSRLRP